MGNPVGQYDGEEQWRRENRLAILLVAAIILCAMAGVAFGAYMAGASTVGN